VTYQLTSEVTLPRPLDEVFDFFADAGNLEAITPPELRFKILTPLPIEMHPGRLIQYQMSLYGVPFKWLTEISVWEPGVRFVDQQLSGPYKVWIHEHRFTAISPDKTHIFDTVQYALPLEPFGRLAHGLVRAKLDRIFSYREQQVALLLG
jgi:ligand-binding SRPBCC domain-containing protein